MGRRLAQVRAALRRKRAEHDFNEELQFHLDCQIKEGLSAGLSPKEARYAALRAMGAIDKSKEERRDLWRWQFGAGLVQDLRFALRLFRKHPAPVGLVIAGLGVTIGVATAVFSIANATMLRPYAMDDPSSIVRISRPGHSSWLGWPYEQFRTMRDGTALATIEASSGDRAPLSTAPGSDDVTRRPISFVSGGYLSMLGARPALGRSLEPTDDAPSAPPVIVVSHHFWTTELNSDPSIIGRTLWVNSVPATVVGVLRPDFTGPVTIPRAVWAPFAAFDDLLGGPAISAPTSSPVEVIARLRPGAAADALESNLAAVIAASRPAGAAAQREVTRLVQVSSAASPIGRAAEGDDLIALAIILALVGLVVALACTNASNLLMASAVTRMREVGIRLAMGASRGRLVQQMVRESLLVGSMAGALGFLLAFWLVPLFGSIVEMPAGTDLSPDWRVLLFTVAIALVCGLGAGLSPARYGARGNLLAALQAQSGSRGSAAMPSRLRSSFIGFQAAVSMLLLVVAALLARSALEMNRVEIGFDADRVIGVRFEAPRSQFDEPAYIRAAVAVVRDVSSVQRASVTQFQPFGNSVWHDRFTYAGVSYELGVHLADSEFFETAGLRVLRGRTFTPDEVTAEAPVALVSDSVARTFFPGRDAVGQSLATVPSEGGRQQPALIIGVVADALLTMVDGERFGTIYRPLMENRANPPTLLIRTVTPAATARAVEDALRRVDPRVRPTASVVQDGLDQYLGAKRRFAWLLGPTAVLALLLSALGIYGVTAFVVGQRTEEISVRMALGASAAAILQLLVKDSLRPVIVGLFVGFGAALLATQVIAQELAGVSPHDPIAIGAAVAVLLISALGAVILPARRAARTSPAGLLRQQ